jgi:hypothetical protein
MVPRTMGPCGTCVGRVLIWSSDGGLMVQMPPPTQRLSGPRIQRKSFMWLLASERAATADRMALR